MQAYHVLVSVMFRERKIHHWLILEIAVVLKLWAHVVVSHENAATVSPDMLYTPTAVQCFEYM